MTRHFIRTRTIQRKRKIAIIAFAKIFEQYKEQLEEGLWAPDRAFNFYNQRWHIYCNNWNSDRGNPVLDTELFSKEANKYLNELRTMPASNPAE